MYGTFTCIWLIFTLNVGKHAIHGWYGYIYIYIYCIHIYIYIYGLNFIQHTKLQLCYAASMPRCLVGTGSMMRTASNCLRRAYAICTKQVEAGSVAGAFLKIEEVVKGWGFQEVFGLPVKSAWQKFQWHENPQHPERSKQTLGPLNPSVSKGPDSSRPRALGPSNGDLATVRLEFQSRTSCWSPGRGHFPCSNGDFWMAKPQGGWRIFLGLS